MAQSLPNRERERSRAGGREGKALTRNQSGDGRKELGRKKERRGKGELIESRSLPSECLPADRRPEWEKSTSILVARLVSSQQQQQNKNLRQD